MVIDILGRRTVNGRTIYDFVESKNGPNSRYTVNQNEDIPALGNGARGTFVGKNARALGLEGQEVGADSPAGGVKLIQIKFNGSNPIQSTTPNSDITLEDTASVFEAPADVPLADIPSSDVPPKEGGLGLGDIGGSVMGVLGILGSLSMLNKIQNCASMGGHYNVDRDCIPPYIT